MMEGILGQIANPQIADVAGALQYRKSRMDEDEAKRKELRMNQLIAEAIPNMAKDSPLLEIAKNDPQKFAMIAKILNIPLNEGERFEQLRSRVAQLSALAESDPREAYQYAQRIQAENQRTGVQDVNLDKWLQTVEKDPITGFNALHVMNQSLNPVKEDVISATDQAKLKLKEREIALKEKNAASGSGSNPYYQPIQTADGLYSFDARTGGAELTLTKDGRPITPAQIDVNLQGQLAGAKTGASEREKVAIDKEKAIATSDKLQVGIDEARKLIPQATGSMMGAARDAVLGAGGIATDKSKAASKLETLAGWMITNVPRMEGPQSNFDVENYKTMAAKVGNRSIPVEERIAALDTLEMIHSKYRGINSPKGTDKTQKKTGGIEMVDANGNRAIVYPDGSFEEL